MSAERNDGGPAFAALGAAPSGDVYHQTGMSLRDWFAGSVMHDQIAVLHGSGWSNFNDFQIERMAIDSYKIADAMLKARSAP